LLQLQRAETTGVVTEVAFGSTAGSPIRPVHPTASLEVGLSHGGDYELELDDSVKRTRFDSCRRADSWFRHFDEMDTWTQI